MFTLAKLYNINCDSISYRGRDKILEKEKTKERRIFYFSACLICRELFNSGSRQLSRFQQKIWEFYIFFSHKKETKETAKLLQYNPFLGGTGRLGNAVKLGLFQRKSEGSGRKRIMFDKIQLKWEFSCFPILSRKYAVHGEREWNL